VDLATNAVTRLEALRTLDPSALWVGISRDGKSALVSSVSGSLAQFLALPLDGRPERPLFPVTSDPWYIDGGPDGSIYTSLCERPAEVVILSRGGGAPQHVTAVPKIQELDRVAVLDDGRLVYTDATARVRLMVVAPGKEPAPLIDTAEETNTPAASAGPGRVAFLLGAALDTVGIANVESGRIERRIAPGKGQITSLMASRTGERLWIAAGGKIWSLPAAGGETREVCSGDFAVLDPAGRELVVMRTETARVRLFRVPAEGGAEREIPLLPGEITLSPFGPAAGALDANGRLLISGAAPDSWFNPLAMVDINTGRITRVPAAPQADHHSGVWLPDGRIATLNLWLRGTLWKFTPRARK
jgi:hypothetical protein